MSKEKVHLREKVLAKGMIGLYLDYSVQGKRKQETLNGIKLFAKPKNKKERDYNKEISNKAREIRNKKDANRATVYGVKGFKGTLIWEDDYQYTITDNFYSWKLEGNGIFNFVKVRTYGDKDEVTFEQLEGRRYYLRRLIEKVISTATLTKTKY